jgi:sulfoxide reductase heme-binding subunit YedZ
MMSCAHRTRSRTRISRHGVLFATTLGSVVVSALAADQRSNAFRVSIATAYASFFYLAVSLCIGPWNVLRGGRTPVSMDLRRDFGIWAAVAGLIHVAAGLQVHKRGRFWLYFVPDPETASSVPVRVDAFGWANHAGLAATAILILLLATSNDRSLRRFGVRRWKGLQRSSYYLAALVVAHGAGYQLIENRRGIVIAGFALASAIVLGAQLLGYRRRSRA